ncbi:ribosomal protein S18-alanine N-acetyltransferase [Cuniculiplasma sp. SKW3]|uniref:ribosomal protein S18-alanine N-acetyltransferase n=1 Tax=unclassified Cuniculiplasma TaxID=2619706 RepID=UPI003FD5ED88
MNIRKMKRSDLKNLVNLEKRSFPVGPYDYNMLKVSYKLSKGMSIVMEESGKIIGYAMGIGMNETDCDVESIAIDPEYQGKGLGRELLQALEDIMRSRGYKRSVLEVRDKNLSAIKLYLSAGYIQSEFLENYYEEFYEGSRNAFRMVKDL